MTKFGMLATVLICLAGEAAAANVAKVRTVECDIRVTGEIEAGDQGVHYA